MNRGKALYDLTHTSCIAVDEEKNLWRTATDKEARVILDVLGAVDENVEWGVEFEAGNVIERAANQSEAEATCQSIGSTGEEISVVRRTRGGDWVYASDGGKAAGRES